MRAMKLNELIKTLEAAQELYKCVDEGPEYELAAGVILNNTAHDVLVYLRAIQWLDRKGKSTTDTAPDSYGMFNVIRVLQDLGLNDNMNDPGADDYADQLSGHLQEAFEAGKRTAQ